METADGIVVVGERADFESAAQHASRRVPRVPPSMSVAAVRDRLHGRRYDSASHIIVCDGDALLGVATIEDLMAAPPDATIGSLMDADAPVVGPGVDREIAAWKAVRHGESALAVVDDEHRFVGVIPPHQLVTVLLSEHEEDLSRLGGYLKTTSAARNMSEEPVRRRFARRIPWLLLGLAGSLAAADVVGIFDAQLERSVILAFFIPAIVYMADAVGTQTETVVVRGLSLGISIRDVIRRELLTGLVVGLAIAALAGPLILWRWGDGQLALSVGIALFAACSTASIVALALPWLLNAAGVDPAIGSGPLATVVQDLLSIWIYFFVAGAVMG